MTGSSVAQAIPIAISPVLTRIYSPQDFGLFAVFVAVVALFSAIAGGRYEMAVLLPDSDEDALSILALAALLVTGVSIVLLLLTVLFGAQVSALVPEAGLDVWLYWVPPAVFLTAFFNLMTAYGNRLGDYTLIAKATVLKSIILAAVQIGLGVMKSGAFGLIAGQIVSNFAATVRMIMRGVDLKSMQRVSWSSMKRLALSHANFPKYQVPHVFLNTFSSQLPVYLFSTFFTASIVGLYALGTRVVFGPAMIISASMAKVFNAEAAALRNTQGDVHGLAVNLSRKSALVLAGPFALFVLFAPELFSLIFGEQWREAGVYTQILSPWLFMVFIVSMIAYIPNLYAQQKTALRIEIVYSLLRLASLGAGALYGDVYLALALFSASGVVMLTFNLFWMLHLTKGAQ
ncbi:oligosaccharide flippase family protein [Sulfurimonas sp. HSL1-2]|uniref:oligosaccharide flippase family protein n=1 Tax=Thiomicrolovo zhangzhouensis TaxID=3131933 RepID=UPI0031F93F2B